MGYAYYYTAMRSLLVLGVGKLRNTQAMSLKRDG